MNHTCKLCGGDVSPRHIIADITYFYCSACDLLQNFYWEDSQGSVSELEAANEKRRHEKWPAGTRDHMHDKGWQMLELMYWPIAWWSRKVHSVLQIIPGYTAAVRWYIKRKIHKLLDLGCGHGVTVMELAKRDHIDIQGIDPYTPTEDPHILMTHLEKAQLPDSAYTGVFSIETFEHLPDFIDTTKEIHRILAPGGVLLVQTSRLEHPEYKEFGEKWFYLEDPRTHIQIFSETSMRKLAKLAGFKSVDFRGAKFARFTK